MPGIFKSDLAKSFWKNTAARTRASGSSVWAASAAGLHKTVLALAVMAILTFGADANAGIFSKGDGVCNIRARLILVRVARHVRSQGHIYERQSFPELSAEDKALIGRLSMRNLKVIKKFFYVLDPYMKEVIVEAVYPTLDESVLKSEEPKFVDDVYKFKNELLEGRANVPPPRSGGEPIILERNE